jgi:hypothetical protein
VIRDSGSQGVRVGINAKNTVLLPPYCGVYSEPMYELRVDFSELARKYAGLWVAMDPDTYEVVSSGDNAETVLDEANKKGLDEPLVTFVVENHAAFVPCL